MKRIIFEENMMGNIFLLIKVFKTKKILSHKLEEGNSELVKGETNCL